jgi:hypothetical protein
MTASAVCETKGLVRIEQAEYRRRCSQVKRRLRHLDLRWAPSIGIGCGAHCHRRVPAASTHAGLLLQACCSRLVAAELDAAAALARANKMRSHREEQKSEVVADPGDSCRAGLNGFPSVPL